MRDFRESLDQLRACDRGLVHAACRAPRYRRWPSAIIDPPEAEADVEDKGGRRRRHPSRVGVRSPNCCGLYVDYLKRDDVKAP
jgi:hypothetical protein